MASYPDGHPRPKKEEFTRDNMTFMGKLSEFQTVKVGMTDDYILDVALCEKVQKLWRPEVGDAMIGPTGNIFILSGSHDSCEELGGKVFFFGGGLCNRDGGCMLDSTYCHTVNKSGKKYRWGEGGKPEVVLDYYHSGFDDFRWIPRVKDLMEIYESISDSVPGVGALTILEFGRSGSAEIEEILLAAIHNQMRFQ